MRECLAIDPKWLVELAPNFFKASDPNHMSKRKRRERVALKIFSPLEAFVIDFDCLIVSQIEPLYDRYNPPNEWRLSRRRG